MRFVNPSLLIWCGLAAVPIVLYLVRPRPRSVRVTTLAFFKSLQRAYQENAWLRRLKQWVSLLLSVLVVLTTGFALARLVMAPPADALKTVVLLVDRSASMQVASRDGKTALADGLEQLRNRLDGLSDGTSMLVVAYDRRPELFLSRTEDRRAVGRALDAVAVRPVGEDRDRALQLAVQLAALEKPAAIWHVTDRASTEEVVAPTDAEPDEEAPDEEVVDARTADPVSIPDGVTLDEIIVGHAQPINAGVTGLQLRHAPASRILHEAYVQVHAALPEPRDAELEVTLNGKLIDLRKLTLRPERSERMLLSLEADPEREGLLAVRIKLAGDVLSTDDTAYAHVPRARPLRVVWVTKSRDPYTELALTALGTGYEIDVGGPETWPPAELPGVVLFDGWTPATWPADVPAVVINPPESFGPVRVVRLKDNGVVVEQVRPVEQRHPLLVGVASDRVSLVQTAVFDAPGKLEPLWLSPSSEALLATGHDGNQPLVVFAFDPSRSENLPLMASYPLLLGNAVTWAARRTLADEEGRNFRSGELVEVGDDREITWTAPPAATSNDANAAAPPADETLHVAGRWFELNHVGPWHSAAGRVGTSSLLSEAETRLVAVASAPDEVTSAGFFHLHGDLTAPIVWLVLLVLVAESWLFHRRAVY